MKISNYKHKCKTTWVQYKYFATHKIFPPLRMKKKKNNNSVLSFFQRLQQHKNSRFVRCGVRPVIRHFFLQIWQIVARHVVRNVIANITSSLAYHGFSERIAVRSIVERHLTQSYLDSIIGQYSPPSAGWKERRNHADWVRGKANKAPDITILFTGRTTAYEGSFPSLLWLV